MKNCILTNRQIYYFMYQITRAAHDDKRTGACRSERVQ